MNFSTTLAPSLGLFGGDVNNNQRHQDHRDSSLNTTTTTQSPITSTIVKLTTDMMNAAVAAVATSNFNPNNNNNNNNNHTITGIRYSSLLQDDSNSNNNKNNINNNFSNIFSVDPVRTPLFTAATTAINSSAAAAGITEDYVFHCKDGLILPCWQSDGRLSTIILHGFVYFIAMLYMFVGVAIIADRFMAAIEQITSQESDVIVRRPNGSKEIISVRIWNETVSNLTLMALGSSAPEIMLSVIEIYAQDFEAGELGPGTIVGSAAFNMFVIIAVCVVSVPTGTLKKIKYLRVFIITLTFSVFAYVWMLSILVWTSPGVIEVWEGLVTFSFFFITVIAAYVADRRLLIYKYLDKHYRVRSKGRSTGFAGGKASPKSTEEGTEMEKMNLNQTNGGADGHANGTGQEMSTMENGTIVPSTPLDIPDMMNPNLKFIDASDEDLHNIDEQREHVIEILKDVKARFPLATAEEVESIARGEIAKLEPKSRAFYRIIAARRYFGSSNDLRQNRAFSSSTDFDSNSDARLGTAGAGAGADADGTITVDIIFEPVEYTVMEDAGSVTLTLTRVGDIASSIVVSYRTENASAKGGSDFVAKSDSVTFGPGEAHKQISIDIINDDEFEDDEHFFVTICDAKYLSAAVDTHTRPEIRVRTPKAKVTILDDDHSGIFGFFNNVFQIPETIGEYRLIVNRYCGARGQVAVPYRTLPATAKPGEDFEMAEGEVVFHNNETQKTISLQIINNVNYEKNSIFYVELSEPKRLDEQMTQFDRGAPRLGDLTKCMIRIRESKDFKLIVDNLMRRRKRLGDRASSWENQLIDAVRVHKLHSAVTHYDDVEGSPSSTGTSRQNEKSPKHGSKIDSGDEIGAEVDEDGQDDGGDRPKGAFDYIFHYLTLFWKILFAFVPPPTIWNGWACFVVAISVIGVLTSLINDLASHFGATVHLKDQITAISLVALGTSVPDTFASKIAAENEKNADSSIGNVTGSNAVNVFLGIGLAWTVAAIYHAVKGTPGGFRVDPGSLAYSVTLFCICAFICASVLMFRRAYLGGELGGSRLSKMATLVTFVGLWIFYLVMSTLEAYGFVAGF